MIRVPGEGRTPSHLMYIGEMPGIVEVKRGRPFVGPAGKELERFMDGYLLPVRDDAYLTNYRKTLLEGKTFSVSDQDVRELRAEIDRVQPQVIVSLGAHITEYFLGEMSMEAVHGIPHEVEVQGRKVTVFPAYNPARALHSPRTQAELAYDMKRLGLYLKGKLPPHPVDAYPGMYSDNSENATFDPSTIGPVVDLAADTEGWLDRPWGASVSCQEYVGWVLRKGSPGWAAFCAFVRRTKPSITFHSALHDLAMFRVLDLDLDELGIEIDDTMIMAYLLGIEPQALKPLMYRHAGAKHDDYSDIVAEPNARIAEEWLTDLALSLPEYEPPVKLTNKYLLTLPVEQQIALISDHGRKATPLEHARKLIMAMVVKDEPSTLRKRWADCRAREIIVDEEQVLPYYEGDPLEATLDEVPAEVAVNYAGRDADGTRRVKRSLRPQITAMGLDEAYRADIAVLPMVDRMQAVGLGVDVDHFRMCGEVFRAEKVICLERLAHLAGRPINPNSGDQVAEYLFDELHLQDLVPNLRIKLTKTKTRYSTNDKTLEAIESLHPSVPLIIEGRELTKMEGTYAEAIPRLVARDGRLHPTLRLTRADTGRVTAADPNVLALPKHSDRGRLIRMGFCAGPGRVLGEVDLSQIEMRVFAHDSQDEAMIAAFLSGKDFHTDTGARIAGKTYQELAAAHKLYEDGDKAYQWADDERFAAKAVNFGILMGITEHGLLDQFHKNEKLHWTLESAAEQLVGWHRTYPGGSKYIYGKHAEARRYGYVRDMWDRLRWVEGIHSMDPYIVAEAERQAQSTPTQSGAAGILKRGMALLWPTLKAWRAMGMWVECILPVHDALYVEYEPEYEDIVREGVMTAMCTAVTLSIPITAKAKMGVQRLGEL